MENIEYRPMQKEDIDYIYKLGKENFGSETQYSWDWSISKIKEYITSSFGTAFVCVHEDKIVGFALAQNKYSEQKKGLAWFTYIMVINDFQSKGIAKKLLSMVESSLKEKGVKEIITDIYEDNKNSLNFFEKQGFEIKEKWFILAKKI